MLVPLVQVYVVVKEPPLARDVTPALFVNNYILEYSYITKIENLLLVKRLKDGVLYVHERTEIS